MDTVVIEKPRDLVELLLKGDNSRELVSEVFYYHRSHQETIFNKVVMPLIRLYAYMGQEGYMDVRNSSAVEAAATMFKALQEGAGDNCRAIWVSALNPRDLEGKPYWDA